MANELHPSARNVVLASPGMPSDSGFLAARDLADVATEIGVEYRLIGGISVGLLTYVHGVNHLVPGRETADADFGATADVIGDARLPVALADRGYVRIQGNRFVRKYFRPDGWGLELVVDLLAPSWTGRLTNNRNIGQLSVDEVPGLSLALARPSTIVNAEILLTDGEVMSTTLALPDVVSALCLKAYAYRDRLGHRDAVDVWRLLEAASAHSVRADDWTLQGVRLDAARILHSHFAARHSRGPIKASTDRQMQQRIRALVRQVVADPTSG